MLFVRKLRPNRSINDWIPLLAALFFFLLSLAVFGYITAKWVLGGMLLLFGVGYGLTGFLLTRSNGYLVTSLLNICYGVFIWSLPLDGTRNLPVLTRVMLVCLAFLLPTLWIFFFTYRLKWRGREIFELAAMQIETAGDGYTNRPRPVGEAKYSLQELEAFARFVCRNLMAMVYRDPERLTFVPVKNGDEYAFFFGLRPIYTDLTWISFSLDGTVSAHMAKKDYLDYRDDLAFDPLCESLGKVFIDFLQMFQRNEADRIIERMNALGIGIFS